MIYKNIWNIEDGSNKLAILKNKIKSSTSIAIFGHDYIDWDCVGSMLGLWTILENMWKHVTYYTSYTPSNHLSWVEEIDKISTEFDFQDRDVVILVDCNKYTRISRFYEINPNYFKNNYTIIIDHHLYDKEVWNLNLIDTTSSSCCEVIWEISKQIFEDDMIDKNVANYLCLGTISDTGNFEYEKDTIRTFSNILEMIKKWADKRYLVENLQKFTSQEASFVWKFIGRYNIEWNIWYTYITQVDLLDYNIDKEQAKAGQSIIKNIIWIPISIVFSDIGGEYGASMRTSRDDINLSEIAKQWWGGGHKKAAAFKIISEKWFIDWIEEIVEKINHILNSKIITHHK